jgi:predicted dehydrogenase
MEGVEIVSVCNRSRASTTKVAEQFNIPKVYENWWELVEASDTDAIVIGTWPYLHHPITLAALAADKHVMCEARMARNANEAREMLRASATKPNLVTQIVPAPFTLRVDNTVKRLIAEGFLADVLAVEIKDKRGFLDQYGALQWREDFDLSGYNTMGLGIWYETLMRWIGTAKQVAAMGKTFVKMRRDPNTGAMHSVRIPEHLDVIAEMECGAQAHFGLSKVSGFDDDPSISLFGSKGTLRFIENKLFGGQDGDHGLEEISIPVEEEGGWRVEEEFIDAIRGEEQISHTTFEDGVKYMEFTEAVIRSMDEGKAISLPLR